MIWQFVIIGSMMVAFVVTAIESVGEHSSIHDLLARLAMFTEAFAVGTALSGNAAIATIGAFVTVVCFVLEVLTDDNVEQMTVIRWITRWRRRK